MENVSLLLKVNFTLTGAIIASFFMPALPAVGLCTLLTFADTASAVRLAGRMKKAGLGPLKDRGYFSSRRLATTGLTLVKIYLALTAGLLADKALEGFCGDFSPLKFITFFIALWQTLSILENESSCNGSRWAKTLRKWLIDKSSRHFDLKE